MCVSTRVNKKKKNAEQYYIPCVIFKKTITINCGREHALIINLFKFEMMNSSKLEVQWSPVHSNKFITWGTEICLYEVAEFKDNDKQSCNNF